jgi:hypothetical protein
MLTRYPQGMLFGLTPLDASTYAVVCAVFAVVACVRCYVCAARDESRSAGRAPRRVIARGSAMTWWHRLRTCDRLERDLHAEFRHTRSHSGPAC